jgi:hypothetical protein
LSEIIADVVGVVVNVCKQLRIAEVDGHTPPVQRDAPRRGSVTSTPEMKKAAEVDFTWAAWQKTLCLSA